MPPIRNPKSRTLPQTLLEGKPHPSRGGARGYDLPMRELALNVKANNQEQDPLIVGLRAQRFHPSIRTTSRWAH
jgi:hypothetical protein